MMIKIGIKVSHCDFSHHLMSGDTMIDAGQHYWEVRFDKESKAFAAGVALRSLGRFDQLGKSSASWCVHLNNWLQQSLSAKHNNKARTLDCPIPERMGIYCNYDEGEDTGGVKKY